jgi:L-ribulose-5-phosphate 4-epimerase
MLLEELREEVCRLHRRLPENHLVTWTSGNISGRDVESNLIVIKPSGVYYEDLTPDKLIVVDMNGKVIEGNLKFSSDTYAHLYIYRNRPDVNGIVHTHSCYATAFAAVGRPIPVVLTAMCDEFGGPIPCGGYAKVGGDEIGAEVIRSIGSSPAILLKNHGVFTVGKSPLEAVKAAVMVEDVAKTVFLSYQLGIPEEIPAEEVKRAHQRYLNEYGQ